MLSLKDNLWNKEPHQPRLIFLASFKKRIKLPLVSTLYKNTIGDPSCVWHDGGSSKNSEVQPFKMDRWRPFVIPRIQKIQKLLALPMAHNRLANWDWCFLHVKIRCNFLQLYSIAGNSQTATTAETAQGAKCKPYFSKANLIRSMYAAAKFYS